ncbi:MAG: FlhC family transcriptional regulator [Acidovorax sp.]
MRPANKLPGATVRPSERQLKRIALVRECAQLGARQRTIEILTGLTARQVAAMLEADHFKAPRGRPPNTPEWYHGGTMLDRTEASVFAAIYRRLRGLEFEPLRALLGAYRHYRSVCWHAPRLSFDRAFDLARHLDGIWSAGAACFSLATCADCGSQFLADAGPATRSSLDCPFCKLQARYRLDPRVQMSFPTSPLPDPACLQWALALKAGLRGPGH